jgi:hypothetical protein
VPMAEPPEEAPKGKWSNSLLLFCA